MRNLLFIGLLGISTIFFSCGKTSEKGRGSGKSHKFVIQGKLENGTGRMLTLQKIGTENLISLDTATIDENGEFSFRESTAVPEFFVVRTEEGSYINLLLNGREKVNITADYNNLGDYSVSGSEESEKIRLLSIETNKVIARMDQFNLMARDSANSPNYAALRIQSNEEFISLMEGLKGYSQNFIDENSGSLISLMALYGQVGAQMMVFHPVNDLAVYEKVDSILFAKYPDLPLAQNLHEYVSAIKAQLAAQQQPAPNTFAPGEEVPDISLPSPDGKIIKLSSLRGKIVLLDFWAAWCQPCRHENPTLVENYAKFHSKGFEIYQVSLDRTREDWLNGIKQDKLNWTQVSDLKYWESSVVSQFNIKGIPMNYLLDKDGKVIASNLRGPALGEKLQEILK